MLGYSLTSAPLVVKDQRARRDHRRRVRRARVSGRLRSGDGPAPLAMVCRAGAWRIRRRYLERRQLAARRKPDVADRLVRSGSESRVLDGRQPGAADRSIGSRRAATTCSAIRSSRSIRTPASASGTSSSRRTTATIGIRVSRSFSWTACGTGRCENCCCMRTATACSTCSTEPTAVSCPATPFVYQNWNTGFDGARPADRRARLEFQRRKAASSCIRRWSAAPTSRRRPTAPQPAGSIFEYSRERSGVRQHARVIRGGPPVHRQEQSLTFSRSQARRAGFVRRHQGARPRNGQDRLGFQDFPGLADQRCARDRRQRGVRRDP